MIWAKEVSGVTKLTKAVLCLVNFVAYRLIEGNTETGIHKWLRTDYWNESAASWMALWWTYIFWSKGSSSECLKTRSFTWQWALIREQAMGTWPPKEHMVFSQWHWHSGGMEMSIHEKSSAWYNFRKQSCFGKEEKVKWGDKKWWCAI